MSRHHGWSGRGSGGPHGPRGGHRPGDGERHRGRPHDSDRSDAVSPDSGAAETERAHADPPATDDALLDSAAVESSRVVLATGLTRAVRAGAGPRFVQIRYVAHADDEEDEAEQPAPPRGRGAGRGLPGGNPGEFLQRLREMDANDDGKISLDEVPAERREFFRRLIQRLDRDGDGAVSLEELAAAARERAGGRPDADGGPADGPPGGPGLLFGLLDTDGDGKLSAAEIAAAAEVLGRLDRDGDGFVTIEELVAPRGRRGLGAAGGGAPGARLLERLRAADANNDGLISRDEAPEFLRPRFDDIDTNGDGMLDREEIRAAIAEMAARFGEGGRRPGGARPGGARPEGRRPPRGEN